MPPRNPFDWSGTDWSWNTKRIAEHIGCKMSTVSCARRRLALQTVGKIYHGKKSKVLANISRIEWKTSNNGELAKKYGGTKGRFGEYRKRLKLPASPGKPESILKSISIRLWRSKTNVQLASIFGVSKGQVSSYRFQHDLPVSPDPVLKFSRLHQVSDFQWENLTCPEIGALYGFSREAVSGFRRYHGKNESPYMRRILKHDKLKNNFEHLFALHNDCEISRLTGISKQVVRRARRFYQLPSSPGNKSSHLHKFTDKDWAENTDAQLSRKRGVHLSWLTWFRRQYKKPMCPGIKGRRRFYPLFPLVPNTATNKRRNQKTA
jgi:hypothetical protein